MAPIRRICPLGVAALIGLAAVSILGACHPARSASQTHRFPIAHAERLTWHAASIAERDPAHAERLLKQALELHPYFGPAHNNLGVLHFQKGELHAAAVAFENARSLLPAHPDPRINLGMTFERAGRVEHALEAYSAALEVHPTHLPAIQALARCQLRYGRRDDRSDRLLETIALHGDESWRLWALARLLP
ncbi:MAG: tetratricopeptide repeat protein [Phycisphaeraceae bacterium]|nr:tetratricopeptide repeat protein [Phycisphaeraceae bacterium]MCW5754939.1 tetratricopeptide repeat protein [Phycisphaeraceae bacterium]